MEPALSGEWRRPRNTASHQKGGIHDDATATDLGFRGGTVAGAIHMEQFPPLVLETFGQDWWRTGGLSLYFRNATLDQEPVRCHAGAASETPSVRRIPIWMENEAGETVMDGTATDTFDPDSTLRNRLAELRPASELRILNSLTVGDDCEVDVLVEHEHVDRQLTVITEPMPVYTAQDARALPATTIMRAIRPAEEKLTTTVPQPYVGLYGAIEIAFLDGPVLADTTYRVRGRIAGLSDSPKTEILWWEFDIADGERQVARVLKMDRLMKASSPLWG